MKLWELLSSAPSAWLKNPSISISIRFRKTWGEKRNVNKWKYFSDDEVKGLDIELCAMLDMARGKAGVPFMITSGLRTPTENDALAQSVKDSAHLTGNAVDIECADSEARFAMIKGLLDAGFTRIGVYSQHIHCDNSQTLPPNVIWYVEAA